MSNKSIIQKISDNEHNLKYGYYVSVIRNRYTLVSTEQVLLDISLI